MHLILSSCDFQNDKSRKFIIDNLKIPIEVCRVLFIPNEKASPKSLRGDLYYDRVQAFGFRRENIYVLNYYNIKPFCDLDIDAIYVSGGNTFATLVRLRKRGFDKEIIKYINKGVTYIGGSAGAHIVTKNIEHVLPFDDNYCGLTDFNGLGLFDGILFCHYTDERKVYYEKAIADGKYKVYRLTNEDSIVVND